MNHRPAKWTLSASKIRAWSLNTFARLLRTGDPTATIDRLFTSRHVTDLQLIIAVAFIVLIGFLIVCLVGALLSVHDQVHSQVHGVAHSALAETVSFAKLFSPVLVIFGTIVAWAYQAGSARLGVVDLFACEISTLCRVAALSDTVRRRVEKFSEGPDVQTFGPSNSQAAVFTSAENYFPVFEGNTRDLQTLEARVVINITAFYTYMKAVRDSMRTLAGITQLPQGTIPSKDIPVTDSWHETARNILYMLFLAFESARHAIADLVEFEPERAERTVVILLSELQAYQFLSSQFPNEQEMHHERLILRRAEYRDLVPRLCQAVEAGRASEEDNQTTMAAGGRLKTLQWEPAWRLLPELRRRYEAAMR